jgi:uncharacterized SAM-binding protein YcdF (DUF218 family)
VIATGGIGGIWPGGKVGAGPVEAFLRDIGIAPDRIHLETTSRNTYENATMTREIAQPVAGQRWLLITSAYHMPRAVGAFRQAGFDVIAYPVDFRTAGWADLSRPFASLPDGLKRVDLAAKEWAGLLAYWVMGRSADLFPAPHAGDAR